MTQDKANGLSADRALSAALPNSHAQSTTSVSAKTKTKIVSFRLSAEAHATIAGKATEAGISTRSWLEQAILQNRSEIVARTRPHPELKPLLFHAGKAGNNLNQIAHRVNVMRLEGRLTDQECRAMLGELQRIQATFGEAVSCARAG